MTFPRPGGGGYSHQDDRVPKVHGRQKVVWELCDNNTDVVYVFAYAEKWLADALVAELAADGYGTFFVRERRVAM
jgi:hypothetical protein